MYYSYSAQSTEEKSDSPSFFWLWHAITMADPGDVGKNLIPNTLGVTWSIAYRQSHLVK
jgi:hypothetical protein